MKSRTGTAARALAAIALVVWAAQPFVGVVRAATPIISTTLSVSPSIAWAGSDVTFTSVITPVSGTPTNLGLRMGDHFPSLGTCEPVDLCSVDHTTRNPTWMIPVLSAPLTIKFHVGSPETRWTTTLSIITDGVGCTGACPPTVVVKRPTVTSSVTYAPTGVVMPGDTLHFVLGAQVNVAGPDLTTLQGVVVGAGLSAPANAQGPYGAWNWDAVSRTLNGIVPPFVTTRVVWVAFDCTVTGALGTDVTVHGLDLQGLGDYTLVNNILRVHIGPLPTPTPRSTPKPTTAPTGSIHPTPTLSASTDQPTPGLGPSPEASVGDHGSPVPTDASLEPPTPSATAAATPDGGPTAENPSASPEPAGSADPPGGIAAVVVITLLVGVAAFGAMRARTRGRN